MSGDKSVAVACDDTRSGNEANGAQDIYFTRARYTSAAETFGGKVGWSASPWAAGFLGAAAALALGGLVLVTVVQGGAREKGGTPSSSVTATPPPAKEPSTR